MSLSMLPCGGLGELGPESEGLRIVCRTHRTFDRDRSGNYIVDLRAEGGGLFRFTDGLSCGAVTEIDARTGQRVIERYVETAAQTGRAA